MNSKIFNLVMENLGEALNLPKYDNVTSNLNELTTFEEMGITPVKFEKFQEDILDIQFTAEELITNKETESFRTKNISKLLNKLPKRQKEAIYLKYYSGLKATEIAEIMDINYQSVVNILYKALKNLKEEVSILNLFK